jgi:Delta7-sterol 5-desaturase
MAFMIVRNVMGHAGVELMPRALADSRWFGWINATTHHDLHHSSFHYNYGLYFTWWDRMMGTEHPRYREQLRGKPGTVIARSEGDDPPPLAVRAMARLESAEAS